MRNEKTKIREKLQTEAETFIDDYCRQNQIRKIWQAPVIKYADAYHPEIRRLKSIVMENHYLPEDILSEPTVILSYYLPFIPDVGESNIENEPASECWAKAYKKTYKLANELNEHLESIINEMGYRAAAPKNAGSLSDEILKSRWSHRHIAKVAGLGTFGMNRMLITENGCCGRYYSIVTDLPIDADIPIEEEFCLYKRNGTCGVCVKHCYSGALTKDRFDRYKCHETTLKNAAIYGVTVCGKCVVGLPCSFKKPD